jgi:photosystem II stability/assembly factor-like uncharacterized protein
MMRALCSAVAFVTMLVAGGAAAFQTFKVAEIYSSADGAVQYVVLVESAGLDGEQHLGGQTLTVTHAGVAKVFMFPGDLPSASTAHSNVLIATQGLADLNLIAPDYVIPNQFLPTDGGSLNYAGVDEIAVGALPTDGFYAVDRNGTPMTNLAANFAGNTAWVPPMPVTAIEYHNAALDHYFISALQPDIDALDTGRIAGWQRTGQSFKVYPSLAPADLAASPVCRFYIPPQHGNSHFLSASPDECAAILQASATDPNYSGYVYETANAFYVDLPNSLTGACPDLTGAVYRLWNGRADSNHRYTTDPAIKAQMVALGYVAEGYGPDKVSMCAPTGEPLDRTQVKLSAVAWIGNQFIAVGGSAGQPAVIVSSADGVTWSGREAGVVPFRGVASSGTQAVIVGANGVAFTSPDGLAWTAQSTGTATNLNRVAWCDTQFVAVGDTGTILTSPDGVKWTSRFSKTNASLSDVFVSQAHIFVVGNAGTILNSTDGITWSPRTSGTVNNLSGLTQTDAKLIAVGAAGTILQSSDLGKTWTPANSGTGNALNGVTWSGTQLVAVGASGRIVTSNGGSNWTQQTSGTGGAVLNDVAWSGSQFAVVGETGMIITSPDGVTWTRR